MPQTVEEASLVPSSLTLFMPSKGIYTLLFLSLSVEPLTDLDSPRSFSSEESTLGAYYNHNIITYVDSP